METNGKVRDLSRKGLTIYTILSMIGFAAVLFLPRVGCLQWALIVWGVLFGGRYAARYYYVPTPGESKGQETVSVSRRAMILIDTLTMCMVVSILLVLLYELGDKIFCRDMEQL